MNSLHMRVVDATGGEFLSTFATNRPGQAESFRKHAAWWLRTGYKSAPVARQPAFPCHVVVTEYQDATSPS